MPNPSGDPVTSSEANDETARGGPIEELDGLLERLALGSLDPAGWNRLGDLIRGDRAAALRYVRAAHDNETLREETRGGAPLQDATPPVTPPLSALADASANAPKPDAGPQRDGWSLTRVLPWGLAVSASFLMGWVLSTQESAPEPAAAVRSVPQPIAMVDTGRSEPLGHITGLTPVASSDGLLRSRKVRSSLGRGEVFQLTRGAARLRVAGGEVLVEGPAVLSAIDIRTVFVRQGKVTVRHPGEITIQTPVAIATGQGATFAVVAEGDAGATFHTIAGSVLADVGPERGRRQDNEDACVVGVGEAVRFAASKDAGVVRTAAKPPATLQAWDTATNDLHDYEKLVLSDKPLAYWPLYRVRRHRAVLDLTQNGHDGYAIGNWPTELSDVHATQSRGAYFDGESYIEADRKPPIDLRSGFTIESWARVFGGPEYQSVFTSRWVLESNTPQEQCFGFTVYAGANDKWQVWTGSGEYGENWQQLHGPDDLTRDRWTHVAASFEPDAGQEEAYGSVEGVVRLFVDGQQVAEARRRMSLEDFEWPARIGAAEFVPQSLTSWLFRGELRDVALYDHVLDPTRIELHSEQGRSAT